jgi:hypothetical protein
MSKVQNPLIGRSSGSIGNSTFSTWKGLNCVRTKPEKVKNPNTSAQQDVRSTFKAVAQFYVIFAAVIDSFFRKAAKRMTASNMFVKLNFNPLITDFASMFNSNIAPLLKLTPGNIGQLTSDEAAVDSPTTVSINYKALYTSLMYAGNDFIKTIFIDTANNTLYVFDNTIPQSGVDTELSFTLPTGKTYQAHSFLYSTKGNKTSKSYFSGQVWLH